MVLSWVDSATDYCRLWPAKIGVSWAMLLEAASLTDFEANSWLYVITSGNPSSSLSSSSTSSSGIPSLCRYSILAKSRPPDFSWLTFLSSEICSYLFKIHSASRSALQTKMMSFDFLWRGLTFGWLGNSSPLPLLPWGIARRILALLGTVQTQIAQHPCLCYPRGHQLVHSLNLSAFGVQSLQICLWILLWLLPQRCIPPFLSLPPIH